MTDIEKKLMGAKEVYDQVNVPDELDHIMKETIKNTKPEKNKVSVWKKCGIAAAVVLCVFTAGLNTSMSFAAQMSDIPLIGSIAKVFTFRTYDIDRDNIKFQGLVPGISGTSDQAFEAAINIKINEKVAAMEAEAEILAKEYEEAYFATGGTKEDYHKIEFDINYEIKNKSKKMLSFVVTQQQTLANAYNQTIYYNIDLSNNKELTIADVLGEDYKNLIQKATYSEIQARWNDPKGGFFEKEPDLTQKDFNQSFYINQDGDVVVVFDQYEIAPGSMGQVEVVVK